MGSTGDYWPAPDHLPAGWSSAIERPDPEVLVLNVAVVSPVKNPIPFLRRIAIIEAISFLILLLAAMPLKYFAGLPLAVRVVGLIHGLLFLVFCFALYRVVTRAKWPISRGALILAAALLPFGPFVVDRRVRQYEREFDAAYAR